MRMIAMNLKPASRLIDVTVMALAAYLALHAGLMQVRVQPQPATSHIVAVANSAVI